MTSSTEEFTQQNVETIIDDEQAILCFDGRQLAGGCSVEVYEHTNGAIIVVFPEDGYERYADAEAFGVWFSSKHRNQAGRLAVPVADSSWIFSARSVGSRAASIWKPAE
jgi:hypothetical protein